MSHKLSKNPLNSALDVHAEASATAIEKFKRHKRKLYILAVVVGAFFLLFAEPSLAGPGGKIAQAVVSSWWGKLLIALLVLFFLPLITYTWLCEKSASRRAQKELAFIANYSADFAWINLRERAIDCFYRIHSAWKDEDLSCVQDWMTDWYWQNQQSVFLRRWQEQGLVNVCCVKNIAAIQPLYFHHRNDGAEHEGSKVVLSVSATLQDYLANRESGEVVEGDAKYKLVETLWTLAYQEGQWLVSNIEEGSLLLDYTKLYKQVPPVQDTLINQIKA